MSEAQSTRPSDREPFTTASDQPAGVRHHPRASDASLAELRRMAGSIVLSGPAPSGRFLDSEDRSRADGAGD